MLYIYLLEDVITDAITEEESTISISEKEDKSTGLFLLEKYLYLQLDKMFCKNYLFRITMTRCTRYDQVA
jgi:hypothetical protein